MIIRKRPEYPQELKISLDVLQMVNLFFAVLRNRNLNVPFRRRSMTKVTVSTPAVVKPSTKPSIRTSKVRLGDGIKPW